jgi:hypothetical protein
MSLRRDELPLVQFHLIQCTSKTHCRESRTIFNLTQRAQRSLRLFRFELSFSFLSEFLCALRGPLESDYNCSIR